MYDGFSYSLLLEYRNIPDFNKEEGEFFPGCTSTDSSELNFVYSSAISDLTKNKIAFDSLFISHPCFAPGAGKRTIQDDRVWHAAWYNRV